MGSILLRRLWSNIHKPLIHSVVNTELHFHSFIYFLTTMLPFAGNNSFHGLLNSLFHISKMDSTAVIVQIPLGHVGKQEEQKYIN